jgi:hypothetical protein
MRMIPIGKSHVRRMGEHETENVTTRTVLFGDRGGRGMRTDRHRPSSKALAKSARTVRREGPFALVLALHVHDAPNVAN